MVLISILQVLGWIVWIAFLFSASILIHEYFHFVVARWCRLRVDRFSIGFGPRIWGVRRGGTDYRISLIPFGGYVSIPQMEVKDDGPIEVDGERLEPAPPLAKIATAAAGSIGNIILAFALACVVWAVGRPVDEADLGNLVGYVGDEAAEAGVEIGDQIVSLNGRDVRNWHQANLLAQFASSDQLEYGLVRAVDEQSYQAVLSAERDSGSGLRLLPIEGESVPIVGSVRPGSPAGTAGLLPGDRIVAFAGTPVRSRQELSSRVAEEKDHEVSVTIERGGEGDEPPVTLELAITPVVDAGDPEKRVMIGIVYGESRVTVHPTPVDQIREVFLLTYRTLRALFTKGSGIGARHLSGPIGIIEALARLSQQDFRLGLWFTVVINISLGVLNLMPIPILDGGHILFSVLEMLRGRPLPVRVINGVQTVFFVLLISFFLYVTWWDGKRVFERYQQSREFDREMEELSESPFDPRPADAPVNPPAEPDPAPVGP